MVNSQFGGILKEFEAFFNCSLEPDANDSCLIKMGIGLSIQIELDRQGLLLIGCRIASLPMGRYRDNLIHAALKFNEATLPSTGIFGYSQKSQQLILFTKMNPQSLSPQMISSILSSFVNKAKQWVDAIAKSETPRVTSQMAASRAPSGLFDLIS